MKVDFRFQRFTQQHSLKSRIILYFLYKRCSTVAVLSVIVVSLYFTIANLSLIVTGGSANSQVSLALREASYEDLKPVVSFSNLTWSERSVIFNRIERTGSRTLLTIAEKLSKKYNYTVQTRDAWAMKYMGLGEQKALVHTVNAVKTPFIYDQSVHYIHFPRYGSKQPFWISLVRDPLRRIISLYYYKRYGDVGTRPNASQPTAGKPSFDDCVLKNQPECSLKNVFRVIPYFCGQSAGCRVPNKWALETAKKNVEENFKFVGVLEELNTTFQVLEVLLPQFFHGAPRVHKSIISSGVVDHFKSFPGQPPSEQALTKMKGRLALEYEFYEFVKEKMTKMKNDLGIK
ncbi:uronyl 2-sulfotransferase-like [Saccoglossus kowalevskii]|uniref:Uronyl 2-sulfotransferase-like isoform X1 n=1 Tax=Saccoglossus kowalevskii TaxID=10224 RepID=A0ABM0GZN3_SACKO|nr:PREDICTED: uronyl 2-sulfotransferase-like isoform X1 [Saccoglossus kowalevskii]XP_006824278.1 PREDICTED: uronyl 2-sulfotransferase-like isoform X2 [Saccoglossus kowalevskii]